MTPKFLFFDLGMVLLAFDHDRMARQMAEVAGVSAEAIAKAILPGNGRDDPLWRLEGGTLSEDEFFAQLCEKLGAAPPRDQFELACSDIFEPIEETFDLVRRLHAAGNRLGILSNTNGVHWRYLLDGRYPVLNECFELPLASFQLQSLKPDREIYLMAAEQAGVAPEEVYFTDDKQENVDGALAVGFQASLFADAGVLARDLAERGVRF